MPRSVPVPEGPWRHDGPADDARFLTGQIVAVNGGVTAAWALPRFTDYARL
jgi:hypothetical protein